MVFEIEIKRKALKNIEFLDNKRKRALKEIIDVLKQDPVPFRRMDLAKLRVDQLSR